MEAPDPSLLTKDLAPQPKEAYGFFFAEINQTTGQRLMDGISAASRDHYDRIHILFQSTGGTVGDGISLYNFIRNAPLEVFLYNTGTVCSVATIAYLGAPKRFVSQHATFMIHRSKPAAHTIPTYEGLKAAVKSLEMDDKRTEAILKRHLQMDDQDWSAFRQSDFWFSASEAVKNGMATDIGDFSAPRGVMVYTLC
jgi:ATP-dependent Clp protease protease subunit